MNLKVILLAFTALFISSTVAKYDPCNGAGSCVKKGEIACESHPILKPSPDYSPATVAYFECVCSSTGARQIAARPILTPHRFGHGTAVFKCKNQCFGAKEICPAAGNCFLTPTPHCI
ncbi:hypothetical protein IQ06DRAFT_305451 [Phaeosphaeriaceae sp. SRC1lsM3a]|nr:hypothetical protein IQ06DRAFT_305451 [Stagonospora sp. SRC1lsM3a]